MWRTMKLLFFILGQVFCLDTLVKNWSCLTAIYNCSQSGSYWPPQGFHGVRKSWVEPRRLHRRTIADSFVESHMMIQLFKCFHWPICWRKHYCVSSYVQCLWLLLERNQSIAMYTKEGNFVYAWRNQILCVLSQLAINDSYYSYFTIYHCCCLKKCILCNVLV